MNPAQWLADAGVEKIICKTLRVHGTPAQDIEDARQDVYVKVLVALKQLALQQKAAPADLEELKALCVQVAHRHAISALRKAAVRARDIAAECEPDELAPLTPHAAQRDPVDAGRQLEVLAQLFRDGKMPPGGVDILEGVASRCTHEEIALDLDIEEHLVKSRLFQMRKVYRRRLEQLGLVSNVTPLHVLVSAPGAIEVLRTAS